MAYLHLGVAPTDRATALNKFQTAWHDRLETDQQISIGKLFVLSTLTLSIYQYFAVPRFLRREKLHLDRSARLIEGARDLVSVSIDSGEFSAEQAASARAHLAAVEHPRYEITRLAKKFPWEWLIVITGLAATLFSVVLRFARLAVQFSTSTSSNDQTDTRVFLVVFGGVFISALVLSPLLGAAPGFAFMWRMNRNLLEHSEFERHAIGSLWSALDSLQVPPGRSSGTSILWATSHTAGQHQFAGRVVASMFTCSLYTWVWMADISREVQLHFHRQHQLEDLLASRLQALVEPSAQSAPPQQ